MIYIYVKNESVDKERNYRLSTRHLINLSAVFKIVIVKKSLVRKFDDAFLIAFNLRNKNLSQRDNTFLFVFIRACTCE